MIKPIKLNKLTSIFKKNKNLLKKSVNNSTKIFDKNITLFETYNDLKKMADKGNSQAREALELLNKASYEGNIYIDKGSDIANSRGVLNTDEITRISNSLVKSGKDPLNSHNIIKGLHDHSDQRYSVLLEDNLDYLKRQADNNFETVADAIYSPERRAQLPANYYSMMMNEKYPPGCFYKTKIWWEQTYGKDEAYMAMFEPNKKPKYETAEDKIRRGFYWLKEHIGFGSSIDDIASPLSNSTDITADHAIGSLIDSTDVISEGVTAHLDDISLNSTEQIDNLTDLKDLDLKDFHFDFGDLIDSISDTLKDLWQNLL